MPLTGQAKTDYQREYMRRLRAGLNKQPRERRPNQRFRILERDNFRCQYCGRMAKDDVRLEIDHIKPRCEGGTNDDNNLITACYECNRSKGGEPLNYDAEQSIMPGLTVRPEGLSANQWAYIQSKKEKENAKD